MGYGAVDLMEKLKFMAASKSIAEVKIQCSIGEQIIKELNTRALTPEEAATVRGVGCGCLKKCPHPRIIMLYTEIKFWLIVR